MSENVENIERLVAVRRVAKTTKGGRNMSFAALTVVGDGQGHVGSGYGKAREIPAAVAKAVQEAKKNFFKSPMIQGTISHPVQGESAAGVVFLRPAAPGTGIIAGGPVRAVLEAAGYTDVLTKSLGSSNAINIVHATIDALKKLEHPEDVAARRGLPLERVAPARLILAAKATKAEQSELKSDDKPVVEEKIQETKKDEVDVKSEVKVDEAKTKETKAEESKVNEVEAEKAEVKKAETKAEKPADEKKKTSSVKAPAKKAPAKKAETKTSEKKEA